MIKKEAMYKEAIEKLMLFPGSISDYEHFRGDYGVEVIDTKKGDKGVIVNYSMSSGLYIADRDLRYHLVDEGIEAIVNTNISHSSSNGGARIVYYGLPVRKKRK